MKTVIVHQHQAGDKFLWALSAACGQLLCVWTQQSTSGADLWAEDPAPFFAAGVAAKDAKGLSTVLQQCDQALLVLPAAMPLWTPALTQQIQTQLQQQDAPVRLGDAVAWPAKMLPTLAQRVKAQGIQALWDVQDKDEQIQTPKQALQVTGGQGFSHACQVLNKRIIAQHLAKGVFMPDPSRVMVDHQVEISPGATIYPDVLLQGHTIIAAGAVLYPGCQLDNAHIGQGVVVRASTLQDCTVSSGATVGPYAVLRNGAKIGKNVRIGDFVEVKNAEIGEASSAAHLSYIGDATVGKQVNIGCGAVFCNYDGRNKHRTKVEDNAFVGANVNLVAPVTVGEGAFIAAGSTVTRDVPPDALYVQRSEPVIRQGWAAKRRQTTEE